LNASVTSSTFDRSVPNRSSDVIRVAKGATTVTALAVIAAGLYATWKMVGLFQFTVDVPFFDQWWFARFLRDADRDGLSLAALWAPHNEHRVFVPRLVLYGLARLTGWNVRAEMALIQAILIARLAAVALAVWLIGRRSSRAVWLSFPLVAAMLCSRAQAENLLWGWQVTLTLGALFMTLCCFSLCTTRSGGFPAAILCALIAQFSFASGVVLWPIGLIAFAVQRNQPAKGRVLKFTIWLAIGATATFLANRNTYRIAPTHPITASRMIRYSAMFLGGPFANNRPNAASIATRFGWIGVGLFTVSVVGVIATKQFSKWLSIVLWGLTAPMTALVTSYGRVGMVPSLDQALASRYVTLSAVMFASAAILLTATLMSVVADNRFMPTIQLGIGIVTVVTSLVLVQQTVPWEAYGRSIRAGSLHNRAVLANEKLLTEAEKTQLFPAPGWIDELRPYLVEKHYTLFRNRQLTKKNGGTQ
jgi:hypothetical protein